MRPQRRVLLKLSGEAFAEEGGRGYSAAGIEALAAELSVASAAAQVAVVVGGGNLFRGAELSGTAVGRDAADRMGMLATLMNGLALRDALRHADCPAELLTGLRAPEVAETFTAARGRAVLDAEKVLVLAGGTGHPFFTTDTAAALRALELGADALLKATKVDGVYDSDPARNPQAKRYETVTFDECLRLSLAVLDQTAFALCRDHGLDVVVFDMRAPGSLRDAAAGEPIGTRVVR